MFRWLCGISIQQTTHLDVMERKYNFLGQFTMADDMQTSFVPFVYVFVNILHAQSD